MIKLAHNSVQKKCEVCLILGWCLVCTYEDDTLELQRIMRETEVEQALQNVLSVNARSKNVE